MIFAISARVVSFSRQLFILAIALRTVLVIIVDSYINRVADNIIDALHQRGIVGMKDTRVHHIVNRADGILLLALAVQPRLQE